MLRTITRILGILLFIVMLPTAADAAERPFDAGDYEAVNASQPLCLRLLSDGTYRLSGGESHLFYYGEANIDQGTLTLYHGRSEEAVFTLSVDAGGYRVKTVSPNYVENPTELQDLFFQSSRVVDPTNAEMAGTYQMGKAFLRRLVLHEDGTYELWRPPVFSYLPQGVYRVENNELILAEQNGWELMRLVIQTDGLVVPDISALAARHFIVTPGDVFVPLKAEPEVAGIYTDGIRTLELRSDEGTEPLYTLSERNKPLAFKGGYFAYNDRLFLTDYDASRDIYADPYVAFEYRIEDNALVPLSVPSNDGMAEWAEATLTRQE